MTTAADRLVSEQHFHDRQAADRAATFRRDPAGLRFADDDYLGHETWVRPAFSKLGDLRGKRALDYGCGHGMAAVVLARRGAVVTAFDLSPGKAFYAGFTLGGLRVSIDGEVLTDSGEPVPGVYSVGAGACNIALDGAGYSSGTQLGEASYFGRRAGRHAAARATSS